MVVVAALPVHRRPISLLQQLDIELQLDQLILGCIAGNKLFYGVINELISSELIPRTAERLGKLHASGLGMKGQSMERFMTQAPR